MTPDKPIAFADAIKSICTAPPKSAYVYSGYLASRIRAELRNDPERIIDPQSIRIETIGDCRYAITCRDKTGTGYTITIEVTK